ncbi:MAG: undecaprenyl-diphosphate phosphatase [Gemmatimonadales bacterium]
MTLWEGLLLGIVQGVTEFLPISSSGHLVVTEELFGLASPGVVVEVMLHVATLMAVIFVYRGKLWILVTGVLTRDKAVWRYVLLLVIGTIPAGLVGILFSDWIEELFGSLIMVGLDFLITGGVLWSTGRIPRGTKAREPSSLAAGVIGLSQAAAILPGISRSGSTIASAMWLGIEPVDAAEYSFLLSIPVVLGAAMLQLPNLPADVASVGSVSLAAGFLASLVSGIMAIRFLVKLLRRGRFHRFAPYCFGIGTATILWALFGR